MVGDGDGVLIVVAVILFFFCCTLPLSPFLYLSFPSLLCLVVCCCCCLLLLLFVVVVAVVVVLLSLPFSTLGSLAFSRLVFCLLLKLLLLLYSSCVLFSRVRLFVCNR